MAVSICYNIEMIIYILYCFQQSMIRSMLWKKKYYDVFKKDTVETVTVFAMQGKNSYLGHACMNACIILYF